ncbi:hypothetical protein AGMMS50239_16940 [Bacteroidia bacterium]|nr:hypothetical protein AGMMS50239_16940 [Bacteroidia bacterium]
MQYIDKTNVKFKDRAYTLLDSFIQGQWQQSENCYVNLAYENFNNEKLTKWLLEEQEYYCCYCMKHILKEAKILKDERLIIKNETTLEHIIPNKSKNSLDYNKYSLYGEIRKSVFFWDESKMSSIKLNMPPFPHILAYENLVVSCNGEIPDQGKSKCCNNARGNKDIEPLFYVKTVRTDIKYDFKGIIICDPKYDQTIKFLNLEHQTLQLFRRCWLNLPSKYTPLDVINASKDEDLRNDIVDDMDISMITTSDKTTIKNSVYWKTFMNYFWFYLYKVEEKL